MQVFSSLGIVFSYIITGSIMLFFLVLSNKQCALERQVSAARSSSKKPL